MTQQIPTNTLTPYITEVPATMVKKHQWNSNLYFVAMIVSACGALAIFGGITALYLGLLEQTTLSGLGTLAAIVTGCVFMQGVDFFLRRELIEKSSLDWYQKLNVQSKAIQHWDKAEISQFFTKHDRTVKQIQPEAMPFLREINPNAPLKALLPLIARCMLAEDLVHQSLVDGSKLKSEMQKLGPKSAEVLRTTYQALLEKSAREVERYQQMAKECLTLLTQPICGHL